MNEHSRGIRLAIVGSRNFKDYDLFKLKMSEVLLEWGLQKVDLEYVVSGGAAGADSLGKRWAEELGVEVVEYCADWKKFGARAGPLRNTQIVENCDRVVAFPSRSGRGTQDTLRKAVDQGLTTKVFYVEDLVKSATSNGMSGLSFKCE